MITSRQKRILNELNKYLPAMRDWYFDGGQGFGDQFEEVQSTAGGVTSTTIDLVPSSAASTLIRNVPEGARVTALCVVVSQAFDGNPILEVGTAIDHSRVMPDKGVDLQRTGTYISTPPEPFESDSDVFAFFVLGGATVGSATITLSYS